MQQMESRLGSLEGAYLQVADRLNGMDRRFDSVDRRFDSIDRRFDSIDRRFEMVHADLADLRHEMTQRFNWLTGMLLTSWVTTMLAILFRHP